MPTGPGWVPAGVALGALLFILLRGPYRAAGLVVTVATLGVWTVAERPRILVDPEGKLVGVETLAGRALNRARGAGFAARVWLENDGDTADQRGAHARRLTEGAIIERTSDGTAVVWTKADVVGPDLCQEKRLVVAPKARATPAGPCLFLGWRALQVGGAHAWYQTWHGNKLRRVSAAQRAGQRPWTRRPEDQR